ncbi:MAG: YicC/YloC family endoribonuclease, partial [Pseudomonadota bacterium]
SADPPPHRLRWAWEIKSVNGRGLEPRFRLYSGFDHLEPRLRKLLGGAIARGSVNVSLTMEKAYGAAALEINEDALAAAIAAVGDIQRKIDADKPRPEAILALRGVIDDGRDQVRSPEERAEIDEAICASFTEAVAALAAARREEGAAMASALAAHVGEIERLTRAAREDAASGPEAIRTRTKEQLRDLLDGESVDASSDRLEQEIALLAVKADIREEIDRLDAHVASARELLAARGPIGRKFDFLTQEFNREANTLCAKAATSTLKQIGLALKAVIDQLREQVQNVE